MVDASVVGVLERLGFADILLWLLSFAIVYGVLSMANIPKSKAVQAIIAIVLAFLTLMAVPATLISTLSTLSTGLLVVMLGLLVFIVMIEAAGIKHYEKKAGVAKHPETGKDVLVPGFEEVELFTKHRGIMAAALIIIAVLLFVGAGGLNMLGFQVSIDLTGVVFIVLIILAVLWMIKE